MGTNLNIYECIKTKKDKFLLAVFIFLFPSFEHLCICASVHLCICAPTTFETAFFYGDEDCVNGYESAQGQGP